MHTGRGCELAPGLPCALLFLRVLATQASGAFRVARTWCFVPFEPTADQANEFHVTFSFGLAKYFAYEVNSSVKTEGSNLANANPDRRLIFLLNVAQRRLQRYLAAQTPKGGVTAAQSGLLFVLGKRDGVLMGEAGRALDMGLPGI